MALNQAPYVSRILQSCAGMRAAASQIRAAPSLAAGDLVPWMDELERHYANALAVRQQLLNAGLTSSAIASRMVQDVYPAPASPNAILTNIASAKNALVADYEANVWPLFDGKVWSRTGGAHVKDVVARPASFDAALDALLSALDVVV